MTSRMHRVMKSLWVTVASTLAVGTAVVAQGEDAAPPAAPPTAATAAAAPSSDAALPELTEIEVHGKRLRIAISDAQDDFFALYNKLNKDHDYDTSCVNVPLNADTQITQRMCIPGFYADALADQVYFQEECKAPASQTDDQGNTIDFSPPPCYTPPAPQLVLVSRAQAYANNLMKVIKSDPRLEEKAGHLDDLYRELYTVQQQYVKAKAADLAAKPTAKPTLGPRASSK
jgi:hypothetical protein